MTSHITFAAVLAVGLLGATSQGASTSDNPPGIVFVVDGVGGLDCLGAFARSAFRSAGLPHEVRTFFWTHGRGHMLADLTDTPHMRARAVELATEIWRLKQEDPQRPIFIIGHSGGAGVALAAAECLPPATLERMVLLSAAVSPGYDLRPALLATRGEIVSFNSYLDRFWLSWGTSHFGTMDRVYGPAAGLTGFVVPRGIDPAGQCLYQRLVQISWEPKMLLDHYTGLHISTTMPGFLGRHVAPWLQAVRPSSTVGSPATSAPEN
jgi:pimeloyl-ACP methyl ester carboxylesterase